MPFGTRTMTSNGSSGSSIQTQIIEQKKFVDTKLNQLDLQLETIESLKKDIDYRTNSLLRRLTDIDYPVIGTTTDEKIAALQSLKDNGIEYFILNFDTTTNSNSEYAPKIAYIKSMFDGLQRRYSNGSRVISYGSPLPLEGDIVNQIDAKIAKLQGATVQAPPVKSGLFGRFGFGGRKQKRTMKKSTKRKTKKHKKKRTRRR